MKKTDIPEVVIDYCIDNKKSIADSLCEMIEDKFATVDSGLRELKRDLMAGVFDGTKPSADKITDQEMEDVNSFIKFMEAENEKNHNKDNDE